VVIAALLRRRQRARARIDAASSTLTPARHFAEPIGDVTRGAGYHGPNTLVNAI
jgi:hypothetical protein